MTETAPPQVKRIVLYDGYAWLTPAPTPMNPRAMQHNTAGRGAEIEVSAEEARRGEGMDPPALGSREDLVRLDAIDRARGAGRLSDLDLLELDSVALLAYVGQHPEEVERVRRLEESRADRRPGVEDLVEDLAALQTEHGAGEPQPRGLAASDSELEAMSAADLVSHARDFPTDVERILELERARKSPRPTVLALGETAGTGQAPGT